MSNKARERKSYSHDFKLRMLKEYCLRKALSYSVLRNEALHELLKIGREQYGIDLLKKAGAKR